MQTYPAIYIGIETRQLPDPQVANSEVWCMVQILLMIASGHLGMGKKM